MSFKSDYILYTYYLDFLNWGIDPADSSLLNVYKFCR